MDATIELAGMKFRSYHGCLERERREGNDFIVDLSFVVDASVSARSDSLEDTVNYGAVYKLVEAEMSRPRNLLETVASSILEELKINFPSIKSAKVSVAKKNPPVGGDVEWSRVTMSY